jgi:hypothetical protein
VIKIFARLLILLGILIYLIIDPASAQIAEISRVAEKAGERLAYEVPIMILLVIAVFVGAGVYIHFRDRRHDVRYSEIEKMHTERLDRVSKSYEDKMTEVVKSHETRVLDLIRSYDMRVAGLEKSRDDERARHEQVIQTIGDKYIGTAERGNIAAVELGKALESLRLTVAENRVETNDIRDEMRSAIATSLARQSEISTKQGEILNTITQVRDALWQRGGAR